MGRKVIAILCLTVMLGGCGSSLRQVTARVDAVSIDERTDQGVRLLVTIVTENPNDVQLPIVRAVYKFELAGAEPFEFTDLPKATLPPNGSQTITLPAAFALAGGDASGRQLQINGTLVYEPPGEVRKLLTEYGVPLPSAGFKTTGTLP